MTLLTAEQHAKAINSQARRVIDTTYGATCWIAIENDNSAIVYYEDEPDCQVSTGNHPSRFINAPKAAVHVAPHNGCNNS